MRSYTAFRAEREQHTTTCTQEVLAFLEVIKQQSHLNAFLHVDAASALQQAEESDQRFNAGTQRVAEGMVVALKDNISFKGMPLTCGSKILEGFEPVYDATVAKRLREAGAIIIGKANCDEFAMGSSNENSAYGPALHPLDNSRVPGGSSGGSAVAVAAGMAHVSLGSDTGGSIRQPAAFCGVFGFKPSYGRISRYGLVAFASSLDQIGPFAHSIEDVALVTDVISGSDDADSTCAQRPPTQSVSALKHHDSSTTIGILDDSLLEGCSAEVWNRYRQCLDLIHSLGHQTKVVRLPGREAWIPTYYILTSAEASANLARFDGVRFGKRVGDADEDIMIATRSRGFGAEVQRRIMLGTFVLSSGYYDAYYKKGQQARRLVADGYDEIFSQCSALFLPTTPTVAFRRGEKVSDPIAMYLNDLLTVSAPLAGIPAISIPAGVDSQGLPIGMQLQTARYADEELLSLSRQFHSVMSA